MEAFKVRMQRVDGHVVIDVGDFLKMLADLTKSLDRDREAIIKELVASWHLSDEEKATKMQDAVMATGAAGELELLAEILERWKGEEIAISDQEEAERDV